MEKEERHNSPISKAETPKGQGLEGQKEKARWSLMIHPMLVKYAMEKALLARLLEEKRQAQTEKTKKKPKASLQ